MKQFYCRSVQLCLDQGYIPKTINRILKQGVSRLHTLRDDDLTVEKVQAGRPRSLSGIGSLEARINNLRAIPGL